MNLDKKILLLMSIIEVENDLRGSGYSEHDGDISMYFFDDSDKLNTFVINRYFVDVLNNLATAKDIVSFYESLDIFPKSIGREMCPQCLYCNTYMSREKNWYTCPKCGSALKIGG